MDIYDYSANTIEGNEKSLQEYRGKALLIVNTASKCGFTSQYKGLEQLYRDFKDRGFVILGFPCNQFLNQEPGTEEEIATFCQTNYEVSFPLFAKIDVNGDAAHPLYQYLKEQAPGLMGSRAIKWNFTKFLVDREGRVIKRYAPQDTPESIRREIEAII
ncbi:MAG: glutathione peroxidase [Deltaproteobacteria bacterium]|nr:glutathione peroxidase [Deltaproteobacteria bacterium]